MCAAVAAFVALSAAGQGEAAQNRTLDLYNTHTKERLTITFKKNGKYVGSALKELNRFLRDWRRNEPTNMDPRLFDTVWEVYSRSGSRQPIHVVSGYRSLATNDMLRSRSRAVAKHSQHTMGKAMDFFLPDVKTGKLREIGISLQRGGVGFYPTANNPFVHIDVGSVRAWPRMSRQQLARLFPDGKTVHIPADGKPLAGYQQALAELKRNGTVARPLAIADEEGGEKKKSKGLLAMLFGDEEDETEELNSAAPRTTGQSLTAGDEEAPAAAPPKPVEAAPAAVEPPAPPPVVVVEATPPKAPERPAEPEVTSLAEATLPAGTPPPAAAPAPEVAAAPPPPPPRQRPDDLPAEVEVAAIPADVRPRAKPVMAVAEEAPVQIASAAPTVAPQLPPAAFASPARPDEPVDARQALAAVAEQPLDPSAPTESALGYASATEPTPLVSRPPRITTASLTAGPSRTPAPAPQSPAVPTAAATTGKADPLAVFTRPAKPSDLPVYDGAQSAWRGVYAKLVHPVQTDGSMAFSTPTVVVDARFDTRPYGAMSSLGFTGVSLTRLPVVTFSPVGEKFASAR
jgi:uncharacterized protein YcbK (DUF882 family)